MAKKLLTSYTFAPGAANAGTITVSGTLQLEQFLLVTNATTGEVIFQFNKPSKGGTVGFAGGQTTLTLEADTSAMDAAHRLQIFVDDGIVGQVTITNDGGSPVPVDGPLTDAELRAAPVPISDGGASITVDGPLTDAQLRAAAVLITAAGLPLPTGAATEATLASIDAKTPALQSGRVPVDLGGATVNVQGPVTISNEVEVTNSVGSPIPTRVQDAQGNLVDFASEESLEVLRAIFRLLKPLGQVTGGGRNHLAVDIANTASVQGTITANQGGNWSILNITNAQMGGVWGFDHAKALSREAYNSGIRSRIS